MDRCIKMWHINVYLAIIKNGILLFATTWIDREGLMINEISQERQISYDLIYIWKLKIGTANQPDRCREKIGGEQDGCRGQKVHTSCIKL